MDNDNNITNSITNTIYGTQDISSISTDSISDSGSLWDKISNISWTTWLLIIIILAFLGINIFSYLSQGTREVTNVFKPIVDKVAGIFGGVTSQVVDVSAEGAKAVVDTTASVSQQAIGATANVLDTGLTAVQDITPQGAVARGSVKGEQVSTSFPQEDIMRANALNKALNTSATNKSSNRDYEPDDAMSSIQSGPQKSGWCYIGEERGYRTCAEVGVNDTCMSGDIFPSQEICINPRLRA